MKRLRWTVVLVAAAVLLAGCGEISNTLTPAPGTADTLTVALDAPPNFSQVGIFEAEARGYFTQTDLKVRFIVTARPLSAIGDDSAQIAISSEPKVLLTRNKHLALASVAAILQGPQRVSVDCAAATRSSATSGATTTTGAGASATATTPATRAPRSHPPLRAARCRTTVTARPTATYAQAPTYNGLNFVVTEHEIITYAPVVRRFVQAVARGYIATRADPAAATENLVKLYPTLDYPAQLAGVKASLANFFPRDTDGRSHPWGYQIVRDWNAFGTWMLGRKLITDFNAVTDADTNELLAGQGV